MSNRINKPISLNKTNAEDRLILNHVKSLNFSGYVKKLILEDIRRQKEQKAQNEPLKVFKKEGNGIKIVIG
jgi:hypothetical protein